MSDLTARDDSPVIVFDLGGVLSSEGDMLEILGERVGVPADRLGVEYWRDRRAYDDGRDDLGYWRDVLEPLGVAVDDDLADELAELDNTMWADIRPDAEQILRELHERGIAVFILSNAPAALVPCLERADWMRYARGFVVSGVLGHSKPDPEIYRAVEEMAGVDPRRLCFIDDRTENVQGAHARGWRAHLWVDDADSRAWLVELGAL